MSLSLIWNMNLKKHKIKSKINSKISNKNARLIAAGWSKCVQHRWIFTILNKNKKYQTKVSNIEYKTCNTYIQIYLFINKCEIEVASKSVNGMNKIEGTTGTTKISLKRKLFKIIAFYVSFSLFLFRLILNSQIRIQWFLIFFFWYS